MAYDSSSLMEALKLFQQASDIAEVLHSMRQNGGASVTTLGDDMSLQHGGSGLTVGGADTSARSSATSDAGSPRHRQPPLRQITEEETFTAMGLSPPRQGELKWSLIGRTTRVQMERSLALCCLGLMLQHQ